MIHKGALLLALLFLTLQNAFAHELWMNKDGGKIVLMYGHPAAIEAYNPEWVKEVRGYDLNLKTVPLTAEKEKDRVSLIARREPAMVTIALDSGYWTKTVDGLRNVSKRGMTDYIESAHYIEPVKSIFRWSERFTIPVGARLEIVPMKDPLVLKRGETLPIKVIFEGNPLAGAVITAHGELTGIRSGNDGRAQVMIEEKGLQVFGAKHKVPLRDDPDADILILQANLTFEVK